LQTDADALTAQLPPGTDLKHEIKKPSTPAELAIVTAQNALKAVRSARTQVFNNRLDAAVTAFFLALVAAIFLISVREWILLLARKKLSVLRETAPTWLPDYAIAEARPLHAVGLLALSLALLREISGEARVDRAHQHCACEHRTREQAYLHTAEERYNGINRCC
jgi:ABC-type nickel/cobalt efflux system permease component RcnA